MQQTIPQWFLPSFFGDVKLEATSETSCVVITTELTSDERKALAKLEETARKKGWIEKQGTLTTSGSSDLKVPIDKAAKLLAKLLKPERTLITAVKFSNGKMEEHRGGSLQDPADGPYRTAAKPTDPDGPTPKSTPAAEPVAATTVAAPVRGCPAPDFNQSEIRAQRVLATFITPEQLADFNRYQRFVSVGQTTGNRYMITSRHARGELATFTRTLYNLDHKSPVCTHDWDVPAAEEMLALHVFLQLVGWESYLCENVEDNMELSLSAHLEERSGGGDSNVFVDDEFTKAVTGDDTARMRVPGIGGIRIRRNGQDLI